jgi:hypothetical protein
MSTKQEWALLAFPSPKLAFSEWNRRKQQIADRHFLTMASDQRAGTMGISLRCSESR